MRQANAVSQLHSLISPVGSSDPFGADGKRFRARGYSNTVTIERTATE